MEIKLRLKNLESDEIGERACTFAENMNGVDSAEFDSGSKAITITLSQTGSEKVVKGAVVGYLEAMDKRIVVTENANGEDIPESKKTSSRGRFFCQLTVTVLLAVFGVVSGHFGAETMALFAFIAAYVIIGWQIFMSVFDGIKEKRRLLIAETAVCVGSLILFLCGKYVIAIAVMLVCKCVINLMRNSKSSL